jgi:tRNA dimethylallyltransferase
LLAELRQHDPETYQKIDRQNPRRVLRAIEVIRLTGRSFSEQRAVWSNSETKEHGAEASRPVFALKRSSEDLRQRIERRVQNMFALGLVAETERLLTRGLEQNRTAMQAIGYRQVAEYLRGERSLEETILRVQRKTWQYAKRQMTWLKHQSQVEWKNLVADESEEAVATEMSKAIAG